MEQQDLLLDLEAELILEPASTGARFANYLIDIIGFYAFGMMLSIATLTIANILRSGDMTMVFYLIIYAAYVIYYTVLEGGTNGRTLGKFITKTKVVKEDGSLITWKDALLRSLCRLVPFEPFSALGGQPWHDKWTKTIVVRK